MGNVSEDFDLLMRRVKQEMGPEGARVPNRNNAQPADGNDLRKVQEAANQEFQRRFGAPEAQDILRLVDEVVDRKLADQPDKRVGGGFPDMEPEEFQVLLDDRPAPTSAGGKTVPMPFEITVFVQSGTNKARVRNGGIFFKGVTGDTEFQDITENDSFEPDDFLLGYDFSESVVVDLNAENDTYIYAQYDKYSNGQLTITTTATDNNKIYIGIGKVGKESEPTIEQYHLGHLYDFDFVRGARQLYNVVAVRQYDANGDLIAVGSESGAFRMHPTYDWARLS